MSKAPNFLLLFYRGGKVITVKQLTEFRAILRCSTMPLAQMGTEQHHSTGLLAVDDKGTVLSVHRKYGQQAFSYTAYGHDPKLSPRQSLLGFNSEHFSSVSRHYLLGEGRRNYDPRRMCFNTPDVYSPFHEGGLNTYTYCLGDPVNRLDPSGHISFAALVRRVIFRNNLKLIRGKLTGTNGKIILTHSGQMTQPSLSTKPTARVTGQPISSSQQARPTSRPTTPTHQDLSNPGLVADVARFLPNERSTSPSTPSRRPISTSSADSWDEWHPDPERVEHATNEGIARAIRQNRF
ncbi:RHS repeat-associated core domain-containing protein [Pseudomonas sp. NPDC089758]|uniref:RHS repeat-associated core domain-containing protein n=1 Tax=Pseudomonas sp. NPDC089758 TaxID=3364473 RepID=UPI00380A7889